MTAFVPVRIFNGGKFRFTCKIRTLTLKYRLPDWISPRLYWGCRGGGVRPPLSTERNNVPTPWPLSQMRNRVHILPPFSVNVALTRRPFEISTISAVYKACCTYSYFSLDGFINGSIWNRCLNQKTSRVRALLLPVAAGYVFFSLCKRAGSTFFFPPWEAMMAVWERSCGAPWGEMSPADKPHILRLQRPSLHI